MVLTCLLAVSLLSPDLIEGTVLNSDGKPVVGAKVGTSFKLGERGKPTSIIVGYDQPPAITDTAGHFALSKATAGYSKVLVALDGRGNAGIVPNHSGAAIKLAPGSQLDLSIWRPDTLALESNVELLLNGFPVAYGTLAQGRKSMFTPAGKFELSVFDPACEPLNSPLNLIPGKVTRSNVVLKAAEWAKKIGRAAPEISATSAVNAPSTVSLSALKGKWVMVDFWATWCRPCVRDLATYIKFYKDHEADRNRFEIVAVHSPDGASFEAIKRAYDELVRGEWAGSGLPFPMIFDSTGETHKRWGITSYPTTVLIDPSGVVVGPATLTDLRNKLAQRAG